MIDLHMHSQESDGSLSAHDLAVACAQAHLTAAALTDHDTLSGCRAFLAACAASGIRGIAAVELSAEFGPGTMHILGYIPEAAIDSLQSELARIQASRAQRNACILGALGDLGYAVSQAEVSEQAGGGVTGRPHIAAVMVARGYVKTRQEAFARFLAKGCPAYRERFRFSPAVCIETIRAHGGVAVLAHPFTLQLSVSAHRRLVEELVGYGLGGIEVFYPEHSDALRRNYQRLACEYDLVQTGGSDYHGAMNPSIMLGRGFGNVYVDDSVFEHLMSRMDDSCIDRLHASEGT